ncbi:ribosome maturation factor RimM [Gammaproteobacteria bacterium LSUCC0112]|nr:ribosome maturation factor RimM [Gammaproteobacteria bacterium LSUCC0112]
MSPTSGVSRSSVEKTPELVSLGRIGSPYGVKGWFKLVSHTQPRENILSYKLFTGSLNGVLKALEMDDGKPHGKGLIAHLVGFDTPEDIRQITGMDLMVPLSDLPRLDAGDYYWHQLAGLQVINIAGQLLGRIDCLMETGANDVMVVKPCEGSVDKHQRLIPWLPDQVIVEVDPDSDSVKVDWEADYLI